MRFVVVKEERKEEDRGREVREKVTQKRQGKGKRREENRTRDTKGQHGQ